VKGASSDVDGVGRCVYKAVQDHLLVYPETDGATVLAGLAWVLSQACVKAIEGSLEPDVAREKVDLLIATMTESIRFAPQVPTGRPN
jgi:hypothetical protein